MARRRWDELIEAGSRALGGVVIWNGAPHSGPSSVIDVIPSPADRPRLSLGMDLFARRVTPPRYRPGMGLRPGGERRGPAG